MATLREYFDNDFKDLSIDTTITVSYSAVSAPETKLSVEVQQRLRDAHNSSTRFFTYYMPDTSETFLVCKAILDDLEKWKERGSKIVTIGSMTGDKSVGIHSSVYSTRIYFYTERNLTSEELSALNELASSKGLYVTIRSKEYLDQMTAIKKPLAFISHDSRDKDLIARPLAEGLSSRLCYVWYDEYSLKIGDSLRESIEKGIKEAKKCVLVLTKNFLSNPGWTKTEFNSIFTRERIFNERIILPIWYKVTEKEIYEYSPSLVDAVALHWPNPDGKDEIEYKKEVEILISKVHTAITK